MSDGALSPLEIEILLDAYSLGNGYTFDARYGSGPACPTQSGVKMFCEYGAIIPIEGKPSQYRTTPLGNAWVRAICATPCPKAVFVKRNEIV